MSLSMAPVEPDPAKLAAYGVSYAELAQALEAANLSDRLAMRFFTHVGDVGRQTLAA